MLCLLIFFLNEKYAQVYRHSFFRHNSVKAADNRGIKRVANSRGINRLADNRGIKRAYHETFCSLYFGQKLGKAKGSQNTCMVI